MKQRLRLKLNSQFFAEPKPVKWGGIFNTVLESTYNSGLFFNVLKEEDAQTTTFGILDEPTINTTAPAKVEGVCNGYPVSCPSVSSFNVTADYPIWVNEVIGNCLIGDLDDSKKKQRIATITNRFAKEEIKHGLDVISTSFPVVEYDTTGTLTINQRIIAMKKTLISQGYSVKDAILMAQESVLDLIDEAKLKCCDWQMANGDMKKVIGKTIGLKGIYSIEDALLPTDVNMMMYIKEYALFNRYCVVAPYFKQASSDHYIEPKVRFAGKELVGFAMYDATKAGVVEKNKTTRLGDDPIATFDINVGEDETKAVNVVKEDSKTKNKKVVEKIEQKKKADAEENGK